MDCSPPGRLLCPWDGPGKNTRVLLFPSPGDLSNPGIKLGSPTLQANLLQSEPPEAITFYVSESVSVS